MSQGFDVTPGREYYVTIRRDDGATAFLLGPFELHSQSLDAVNRGKNMAVDYDPWAAFCAFGTASLPAGTNKKTKFGK